VIRSLLKSIASLPSPEAYDRAKTYSIFRGLQPQVRAAKRLRSREAVWDEAIHRLGHDQPVLYLEFGVYQGYSIRYFAQRLTHPETRLFGFDSFEGLPEQWGAYGKGTFSTGGSAPQTDDPRVQFVKGWFQDTVPRFLAAQPLVEAAGRRSLRVFVHFDADLYSSTLFLLTTLRQYVSEYDFCFDEFMGHELRALSDFAQAYPSRISFFAYDQVVGYPGRMLGRLERKEATG
jgi:hypothetical protein